jgi:hypothetical protein
MRKKILLVTMGMSLAASAFGQELSEAQRAERCQNNIAYIAAYQKEIADLGLIRSADVTAHLKYGIELYDDAIEARFVLDQNRDQVKRRLSAGAVNIPWDPLWEVDILAFQIAYRNRMAALVKEFNATGESGRDKRVRFLIEQIEMHSQRMGELRCNEQNTSSGASSTNIELSGEWNDNWGYKVLLKHSGGAVTGTFISDERIGTITSGTFNSQTCVLKLEYTEPWKQSVGRAELLLSADGQSLGGQYSARMPAYPAPQEGGWTWRRRIGNYVGCTPK